MGDFAVGQRVRGRILVIKPFGAFVDLGDDQWAALVRVPNIAWTPIFTDPTALLEVGQEIEAEILAIAPERHQISLSMKRLQENPWLKVESLYKVGQIVEAVMWRRMDYGIFAHVKDYPAVCGKIIDAQGSEFAEGQTIHLYLIELDVQRERAQFSVHLLSE